MLLLDPAHPGVGAAEPACPGSEPRNASHSSPGPSSVASIRARMASEFSACLLITWCAAMASMIAFINSSLRLGELVNCSLVFAAAWLRSRSDSSIFVLMTLST